MIANSLSQAFVWGKISDKYQARAILVVVGETIAAFGYIVVYFVHVRLFNTVGSSAAAYSIIAGLSLLEFFWSMSNLGWSALISDLSTSRERGQLMSIIYSVGGVGRIIGISVSGLLYNYEGEGGGFRNGVLFFFASGIMLASAVVIWLGTRSTVEIDETRHAGAIDGNVVRHKAVRPTSYNPGNFYWFLTSIFIVGLGIYSILQILILYVALDSPIGANSLGISMIRNSASIASIITSLLAGHFANRVGRKKALGLGLSLAVVTPLLYVFAQNPLQMIMVNSLTGISTALINVVGYLLASDIIPADQRGRLFGQYNAATHISFGIAGTAIGGPIADYLISSGATQATAYVATFQVASAISVIGTITFMSKVKSSVCTQNSVD